jgi:hypothetical protein
MTNPTTTKQYISQIDGLTFTPLYKIAKDIEQTEKEVLEALIRFNHENKPLRPFIMVTQCILEIDTWAYEIGQKFERSVQEEYLGNSEYVAPKEVFSGFLEVPLKNIDSLMKHNSTNIKVLWEDAKNYVALESTMKINCSSIYISNDDKPSFIEKLTGSDEGLITPELANKIRNDFSSSAGHLLKKLSDLEDRNKKLETELHFHKKQTSREKSSAQKLLIAGLIETLLQATEPTSPYLKDNGKIDIAKLVNVIVKNIRLDDQASNTSGFRNMIPTLWDKHAKKSIKASKTAK